MTMVDEVDAPPQDALSPVSTMTMGEFPDPGPEGPRAASAADASRRQSAEDLLAEARERLGVHNIPVPVPATPKSPATPREELLADAREVLGSSAATTPRSPGVEEILAEARGAMGVSHSDVGTPRSPGAMALAMLGPAAPTTPSTPLEAEREAAGVHDVVHPALRGRASPVGAVAGPISPDESVEVELDEVDDEVDLDAHLPSAKKGPARKRVAFAKVNPAPLSPLSLPDGPRPSLLSPRSDDDETLETFDDEGEAPNKRSLLSKSAGRPLKSPRAAPTDNTDNDSNPPQKVVDLIPDDESEASLLVLMRYMGCTPLAYGDGPSLNLRAQQKMADHTGREFQFTFEEDDSNTILSDEGTYRTCEEDTTVVSSVPHEDTLLSLEGADTLPSVPQEEEEEEEGVEMGLDDLVPLSSQEPASPVTLQPVTLQELAAKVGPKKKIAPKTASAPQRTNATTDKKQLPRLTVETERKDKIQTLLGEVGKDGKAAKPGVLSDNALHAFLDGCSLDGSGSWYETPGDDKRPEGVSPTTALGRAAAAVNKSDRASDGPPQSPALAALQKCMEDPKPGKGPSALERYRNATPKARKRGGTAENGAKKEATDVSGKEAAAAEEEAPEASATMATVADPAKKKKKKVGVAKKNLTVETKPLADNLSPASTSSEPTAAEDAPQDEPAAEHHRPTTDAKIESLSQTALSPSVRQLASALSPKHGAIPDDSVDGTPTSAASSIRSDSTRLKKLMAGATAVATVGLKENPAPEEGESRDDVVKEAPSSRSDKENGSGDGAPSASRATASLTVDTGAGAAAAPSVRSPARESVREVDALLTKTRRWLVRHGEAQSVKRGGEGERSFPNLATGTDADRRVMGNLTARAVPGENGTESAAEAPSLKEQLRRSTTAIDAAGSKETFSSTLSSTRGASGAPKKSILEQLDEIRAKQKEIEARQAAKGKQVAA